nr:hypothetical protein [Methanobacterium formicicum]
MKVLIITYYFFQNEAIGSFRLRGLNKYLKDYGWEPTILTIKTNESEEVDCNVIKTEFADPIKTVKKKYKLNDNILSKLFLRVWLEINAYPDVQKKWIKTAVESGRKLLREEQFDAIISSSSPISCHLIAHDLKKEFDIPWIADFRDLWTQNHYYNYTPIRKFF